MQIKKLIGSKGFIISVIVIVLLFFGIKNMINSSNESFDDVSITASCPSGYKQFTDKPGNSLCCSGNIDNINHICDGRTCTLNTSVDNPNKPGSFYESCTNRNYEIVDKFSYRLIDGPGTVNNDISYGDKIKDVSFNDYKEKMCDKNPNCGGVVQHTVTFPNKPSFEAYSAFPTKINNIDVKKFIYYENANPYTLPNGVKVKSTIHYKKI